MHISLQKHFICIRNLKFSFCLLQWTVASDSDFLTHDFIKRSAIMAILSSLFLSPKPYHVLSPRDGDSKFRYHICNGFYYQHRPYVYFQTTVASSNVADPDSNGRLDPDPDPASELWLF